MPLFLSHRQPGLTEQMDRMDCDPALLENTYRQFATINLLLSQWKRIYKNELRPMMQPSQEYSLLDIGFGGGDVSLKLAKWAERDGIRLQVTGIETDPRAFNYAEKLPTPDSVSFRHCSSTELTKENASFDFVISNHLLHHLNHDQTMQILNEAKKLSSQKVILNDIERSDLGYILFTLFARLIFRKSFIVEDGLISIKRSYTKTELLNITPDGWNVRRMFPFRLLLTYDQA